MQIASVEPYQPYRQAYDLMQEVVAHNKPADHIPWLSLLPVGVNLSNIKVQKAY